MLGALLKESRANPEACPIRNPRRFAAAGSEDPSFDPSATQADLAESSLLVWEWFQPKTHGRWRFLCNQLLEPDYRPRLLVIQGACPTGASQEQAHTLSQQRLLCGTLTPCVSSSIGPECRRYGVNSSIRWVQYVHQRLPTSRALTSLSESRMAFKAYRQCSA